MYFVTRSFSGEDTTLGGSLFKTLLFRMNIGENPYSITLLKLFSNLWRDLSRYFSIPLVISCVLSAILLFKEKDRLKKSILTFLWLTLIFMTSSLFILGNLYYIHNYIIMIIIIPFFALSTYGIYELIKRIKNKKAMIVSVIIFIAIIGLFYISPSIKYSAKLSEDELRTFPLVPFLKSNDGNFISYYPGHPEAFQTRYYHRGRTIIAASSDENLLAILEENSHTKKYDYLVTKREKIGVKGDTHDHLYSNYPNLELAYDWIIFKLNP